MRQLRVHCKYHFCRTGEDDVSPASGELSMSSLPLCYEWIVKHEKQCEYALVPCKYSSKCEKLRKKDVEKHEKNCVYRPLECSHCHLPVESNKMEEHLHECTMIPITCDKCTMTVERRE